MDRLQAGGRGGEPFGSGTSGSDVVIEPSDPGVRPLGFGAEPLASGGVRFSLWAPSAERVEVLVGEASHPMDAGADGWKRAVVPEAGIGSLYGFRIGDLTVPDPASRFQPRDVFGPSRVEPRGSFPWTDAAWRGRPWEEIVLYEVHVGTATPEGTFAALANRLEELAGLGVTALSLMPIADFAGARNWGYDGVLPYAPDHAYGEPDDLRRLVDRAHAHGISVVLDVVYNHFGPAGNYLPVYADAFFTARHRSPWGDGLNFDGSGGVVREFFIGNALYWLEEFHVDGLRFDAVHAILDDSETHLLAELARRIRAAHPGRETHLILENEHNEARWLERDPSGHPPLYTAQWNDDVHHCWHVLLTGERESYYGDFADRPVERLARCLAEGFAYQGDLSANLGRRRGEPSGHLPPSAFVSFLQNHDQVGNRALGDRLAAPPERLSLARAALLLAPQVPMLFMGEEWGAETPFRFFVDFAHDEALSSAVRDGRRREFAAFAAYGTGIEVPDPTASSTYLGSRLDHDEKGREPHAAILAETRALLALRRQEIVPLTRTAWLGADLRRGGPDAVDVLWRYGGGSIRFAANFGDDAVAVALEPGERPIWRSDGAQPAGAGIRLPAWTGIVTVGSLP